MFRVHAYNASGDTLFFTADADGADHIEGVTATEAYDIMATRKSGHRWNDDTHRFTRNRIARFRLVHASGHSEHITPAEAVAVVSAPKPAPAAVVTIPTIDQATGQIITAAPLDITAAVRDYIEAEWRGAALVMADKRDVILAHLLATNPNMDLTAATFRFHKLVAEARDNDSIEPVAAAPKVAEYVAKTAAEGRCDGGKWCRRRDADGALISYADALKPHNRTDVATAPVAPPIRTDARMVTWDTNTKHRGDGTRTACGKVGTLAQFRDSYRPTCTEGGCLEAWAS